MQYSPVRENAYRLSGYLSDKIFVNTLPMKPEAPITAIFLGLYS
tara:strand:+ start:590 stop:721 length:132 start_codon:yes stop_codon:yes gene_type:complete